MDILKELTERKENVRNLMMDHAAMNNDELQSFYLGKYEAYREAINLLEANTHKCHLDTCTIEIQEDLRIYACGNVFTTELNKYFCYCRNHDCSVVFDNIFTICNSCRSGECIICTNCKRDEFNGLVDECNGCGEPDNV